MTLFHYPQTEVSLSLNGFGFTQNVIDNVNAFLKAVCEVKKNFYNFDFNGTNYKPTCVNVESLSHVERVFAYELYHQWSKIIDRENWVLNGEAGKYLQWFYENRNEKDLKQKYPDLVQYSLNSNDEESHMIVCEIKREYNVAEDLQEDILKLYGFTCSSENDTSKGRWFQSYKCGIFLMIGNDISVLQRNLEINKSRRYGTWKVFKQIPSDETKKILCVLCKEKDGKISVQYQSLYNIVEDKLNNKSR